MNHKTKITSLGILKVILVSILIALSLNVFSQDLIIDTKQDTIYCKVVDIQKKTVFYFPENSDTTAQAYRMLTKMIRKIVLSNGEEVVYVNGMDKVYYQGINSVDFYDDLHKNAIKLHLMSLPTGSIAFTYERSIKPGMSIELGGGYIYGIGDSSSVSRDKGYIIRGGVKLMRPPKYYEKKGAYAHILKGVYIKPEVIFNSFQRENVGLSTPSLKVWDYVSSTSIVLNMGKQVVYNDILLIDWYGFIGYGRSNYPNGYFYSNAILSSDMPVSLGLGFRIGFLFL